MSPAYMIILMHMQFGLIFCYIITYSVRVTSVCCEQDRLTYSTYWACPKHNTKPVHVVSMEKQKKALHERKLYTEFAKIIYNVAYTTLSLYM